MSNVASLASRRAWEKVRAEWEVRTDISDDIKAAILRAADQMKDGDFCNCMFCDRPIPECACVAPTASQR